MIEIQQLLDQFFKPENLRAEIKYESGKELVIYYTKKDYIKVLLDKYTLESESYKIIKRYKNHYIGICKLCKWVKEDNRISGNISKILSDIFKINIPFNINLKNNKLSLTYFNNNITSDTHNIDVNDFQNYMFKELIKAVSQKKPYKYLEKSLKDVIKKNNIDEINSTHIASLKDTYDYKIFMSKIDAIKAEFLELQENLEKVHIKMSSKSLLPDIDDNFCVDFSDNEIIFSSNGFKLFSKNKKITSIYDNQIFEDFFNNCHLVNNMYYDIFNLMAMNNCNMKNLGIFIDKNNKFFISNYYEYKEIENFNSTYMFIINTCKNINNINFLKDIKKYAIICANNVNLLYQCVSLHNEINIKSYLEICEMRDIEETKAMVQYMKIEKILPMLQSQNIILSYSFKKNNDYLVEFSKEAIDIISLDCYELREKILPELSNYISLEDALKYLSSEYMSLYLNKDMVRENSLKIINMLDNKEYCENFKSVFLSLLPDINEKYIPLIKMKLSKIDARENMGDLYDCLKDFCEKGREEDEF